MKKTLLFSAFAASIAISAAAQTETPSMVWGWCEEPKLMAGEGPGPGSYCASLIGLPDNISTKFDGCEISSILIARGFYAEENPVIDIMVFKAHEYTDEWGYPAFNIDDTLVRMENVPFEGEPWDWVEFQLPEPIAIHAGEYLVAGWQYLVLSQEGDYSKYMMEDGIPNDEPNSSWMGNEEWGFWSNSNSVGANCIRLRITGDNLPSEDAAISGLASPRYLTTTETFNPSFAVVNRAAATIESLEIAYGFAGFQQTVKTIDGLSIAAGDKSVITLEDIAGPSEGNLIFSVNVQAVNGKNDLDPSNNYLETPILCLDGGYKRNVVVEEGTGTWCGNCPRGIVGMRQMAEKYHDSFFGIAMHYDDQMQVDAYMPIINKYIDGFPYSMVNRMIGADPNFTELESVYNEVSAIPAIADVQINDVRKIGTKVFVDPQVEFAVGEEDAEYGWAYVITENNVGPYVQTNYYTGGDLEGWDENKSYVVMNFDEVARQAVDIEGAAGVIPSTTVAGEVYSLPMTIDASNVTDFENAYVIAMIVNMKTGYIENAARMSLSQQTAAGVIEYATEIVLGNGTVTLVSGSAAEIFSIDGKKVASIGEGQTARTGAGLFIVKTDGKTYKVNVK